MARLERRHPGDQPAGLAAPAPSAMSVAIAAPSARSPSAPNACSAQIAMAIDQHQRRRALHAVGLHRDRNRIMRIGARRIHADRKRDPILVQERLQRDGRHRGVMLEHRVQADHHDVVRRESRLDALRLRQSVLHATRTQHLERMQHHHPAAQIGRLQRGTRVEPLPRGPCRRGAAGRVEAEHHRRGRRSPPAAVRAVTFCRWRRRSHGASAQCGIRSTQPQRCYRLPGRSSSRP